MEVSSCYGDMYMHVISAVPWWYVHGVSKEQQRVTEMERLGYKCSCTGTLYKLINMHVSPIASATVVCVAFIRDFLL